MIPLELLTMLGSGIFSGALTLFSKTIEAKKENHRQTMAALGAVRENWKDAREFTEAGISFTRRTIALTVVFSVVLLPKLVSILYPDVQVVVGYTEWNPGFWPISDGRNEIIWKTAQGLVLTPLDTHFASAVIGLYFGHKVSK